MLSPIQCSSETCKHHERVPNSFETRWYQSVNAFTTFAFTECVCFCLAFLWFVVFYSVREPKRHFCFTFFRDRDSSIDLDVPRNRWSQWYVLCNGIVLINETHSPVCAERVRNAFLCSRVSELHCKYHSFTTSQWLRRYWKECGIRFSQRQ